MLEYCFIVGAYVLASIIVSVDFIRYAVWTIPIINRYDYETMRDTIILVGAQLLARLFLIGVAGKMIFAGMV